MNDSVATPDTLDAGGVEDGHLRVVVNIAYHHLLVRRDEPEIVVLRVLLRRSAGIALDVHVAHNLSDYRKKNLNAGCDGDGQFYICGSAGIID